MADSHICPLLPLCPGYINSAVEVPSTKVQADGANRTDQAARTDPKSAEKKGERERHGRRPSALISKVLTEVSSGSNLPMEVSASDHALHICISDIATAKCKEAQVASVDASCKNLG
jgi:hypothetical protein